MKYIAYFDDKGYSNEDRLVSLAAVNKLKYIFSIFDKMNLSLGVFSASYSLERKGFYKIKKYNLYKRVVVHLLPSFGCKNRILKYVRIILTRIMLTVFLLLKTKKNEILIVYHSISFAKCMMILKKVKNVRIVLELEEIYQDVQKLSAREIKNENKLIELADAFLFPSNLLNSKFNVLNKPFTIIYGTYCVGKKYPKRFEDGRIHIVYSGTLDPRKGGALAAAAAEFLDEHYHIHILGFGSKNEKKLLENTIEETRSRSSCVLSFDGELRGEEYTSFLQRCDIGLSTQNPEALFNDTSFPSKILSYLANGLRVVSIKIPAIEETPFSNLIEFYNTNTPEVIAQTIKHIDCSAQYNSREMIRYMDLNFRNDLMKLLEEV